VAKPLSRLTPLADGGSVLVSACAVPLGPLVVVDTRPRDVGLVTPCDLDIGHTDDNAVLYSYVAVSHHRLGPSFDIVACFGHIVSTEANGKNGPFIGQQPSPGMRLESCFLGSRYTTGFISSTTSMSRTRS